MKKKYFGLLLFLFVFSIYLYNMCPTVSEGDSGEFITAAVNYSIPHAPSYPLYTTIGKAFQCIIPCADYAYRINLVSVVFSAAAVALIWYMLITAGAGWCGALAGSLCLAFSSHFIENALISEVFGLHAFFTALLFLAVFLTQDKEYRIKRKALYITALIAGLGFGNHQTIILAGPGLIIWFFYIHTDNWRNSRFNVISWDFLLCIFFFFVGLSIYGVLPVRSLKNPFLDWSNPENWHNFWRVFTRADYGSFSLTLDDTVRSTPLVWIKQILRYAGALVDEFTWVGVGAGFSGFVIWLRSKNRNVLITGIAVFISFVFSGIVFLIFANMPFDAQSYGIMGRFYIMPALFFSCAIGYLFSVFKNKKYSYLCFIFLLLPVFLLYAHTGQFGRRNYYASYDYGANNLKSLQRDAYLFIDGGDDTFYTLAYLTHARYLRQDLKIYDRGGLIFPNPYGDDFRRIGKDNKETRRQQVEEAVLQAGKPLYFATMNKNILPHGSLYKRGILFQAKEKEINDTHKNLWPFYSFRGVYPCDLAEHVYRIRALLPVYDFLRGGYEYEMENKIRAQKYWQRARNMGHDISWLSSNGGIEFVERGYNEYIRGNIDSAQQCYTLAIEFNPKAYLAYIHLGVIAEKRGDLDLSEEYYRQAIGLRPDYAEAYYNLSVVYWQKRDWDSVVTLLRKVLDLKPDHQQAKRYLPRALQKKEQHKK